MHSLSIKKKEKCTYINIDSLAPPFVLLHLWRSAECLAGIAHVFLQQAELACDEACVVSVAGPSSGVDDIESGVDVCASLDELWEDERRWWLCRAGVVGVGCT